MIPLLVIALILLLLGAFTVKWLIILALVFAVVAVLA